MNLRIPLLLAACSVVASLPCQAQRQPIITDLSISGAQLELQWEGGEPPFTVQSSTDLTSWNPLLQLVDSSVSFSVPDGPTGFFRVAAEKRVSGKYLGQLRVDEGEFGTPLARHRLKSLWDFYLPGEGEISDVPREYFQQLTLRLIYREGQGLAVFTGKLGDLPGARLSMEARKMTVSWTFGEGAERRDFELVMEFNYFIARSRAQIHLSDPRYTLTCTYSAAQPEAGFERGLIMVESFKDEVSLYQMADQNAPAWWHRDVRFRVKSATFGLDYFLGVPMLEGRPAFIWKTPILDEWGRATIITGLTSSPLEISDRFARTYQPGHHNFVETFWIEPALIPGLADDLRAELQLADIRFIVVTNPFSFPESDPTAKLVGFDLRVRDL